MKKNPVSAFCFAGLLAMASIQTGSAALAEYYGPEYNVEGGSVGANVLSGGKLTLSTEVNANRIDATFTKGSLPFDRSLVFYIDSVSGGFQDTSTFSDRANDYCSAASGYGAAGRSTATFASGFQADYAIVLNPSLGSAKLFELAGGADSHTEVKTLSSNQYQERDASFQFQVYWSELGSTAGANSSMKFVTTYLNPTGYRYQQSLEDFTMSAAGFNPITFNGYDVFPMSAVPEPANVALGICGGLFGVVTLWRRIRKPAAS